MLPDLYQTGKSDHKTVNSLTQSNYITELQTAIPRGFKKVLNGQPVEKMHTINLTNTVGYSITSSDKRYISLAIYQK